MNKIQLFFSILFLIGQVSQPSGNRTSPKLNPLSLDAKQPLFELNSDFKSPFAPNAQVVPLPVEQQPAQVREKIADRNLYALLNPVIVTTEFHPVIDAAITTARSDFVCMVTPETKLEKQSVGLISTPKTTYCVIVFLKSTKSLLSEIHFHSKEASFLRIGNIFKIRMVESLERTVEKVVCCC